MPETPTAFRPGDRVRLLPGCNDPANTPDSSVAAVPGSIMIVSQASIGHPGQWCLRPRTKPPTPGPSSSTPGF